MKRKRVLVQVSLKPKESEKERLAVLKEREKHYGSYTSMAKLHNKLQRAIRTHENFENLPNAIKLSLEMILHKVARCVNGDYKHKDNFIDIQGYSALALESLERENVKEFES
ncbi:DUF6378 domain-containing protein [Helicobacter pylori]|uniref:DUF6378 domain-containing protein n=1 Tax=Helicobacter pylori TaxID=210 RepID=UPI000EAD1099|nr:DUF6378 domain-containing protein [Helicobacter pylori]